MTDISALIDPTTRRLSSRDHDGQPARVLTMERTFDTTVDDLWDALTSAERIPRWFMPVSGDLRLGGRYQLEGNAGGEITACDAPTHLAVTWEFGDMVSWVEVRLSAAADGARLHLEHIAHVPDEMWDEYGPGAAGIGWDMALMGLTHHLEDPEAAVDPSEAEAWMASDEGRDFVRRASAAWVDASVADGTDPAAAQAAGERVTDFYTP